MPTNFLPVYSMYGHTVTLAREVAGGEADAGDVELRLKRIAEFPDLRRQLADDAAYRAVQQELDDLGTTDSPTCAGPMASSGARPHARAT